MSKRKKTIEELELLAQTKNMKVLERNRENNHKWDLKCLDTDCGKIHSQLTSRIGKRQCPHCPRHLKETSTEEIENILANSDLEFISKRIQDNRLHVELKCINCSTSRDSKWLSLKNAKTPSCTKCNKRMSEEEIVKRVSEVGGYKFNSIRPDTLTSGRLRPTINVTHEACGKTYDVQLYCFSKSGCTKCDRVKKFEEHAASVLEDLGIVFSRQTYVKPFYVDFYIHDHDLFIEIDEQFHKKQSEKDSIRQSLIENETGIPFERIDATKGFDHITQRIEEIICHKKK